ncbi:MAG TPA: hypothetical protein VNA16_03530, partial [Abditibacteriaceae bacterium]|nr:hypothetical protein [Abditibacteriaceae bacterium]
MQNNSCRKQAVLPISLPTPLPLPPRGVLMLASLCTVVLFSVTTLSTTAWAQDEAAKPPPIDHGDTAWMLTSAAFVFLMTPALAFFYAGMVRPKNALNTLMLSFAAAAVIGVAWVLAGYSIAFAPGNKFFGGLQYLGLNGVGLANDQALAPTIPHQAFMIYQAMFAII